MNLIVKVKLRGENRSRIRLAARIKVDTNGCLTIFGIGGNAAETICMTDVEAISIQSTTRGKKAAA